MYPAAQHPPHREACAGVTQSHAQNLLRSRPTSFWPRRRRGSSGSSQTSPRSWCCPLWRRSARGISSDWSPLLLWLSREGPNFSLSWGCRQQAETGVGAGQTGYCRLVAWLGLLFCSSYCSRLPHPHHNDLLFSGMFLMTGSAVEEVAWVCLKITIQFFSQSNLMLWSQ